jgi:hypothetical protein
MGRGQRLGAVLWRGVRTTLVWAAMLVVAYAVFLRPWQMRWGATDAEVSRRMPGDDIVQAPDLDATRAITVAAAPGRVWARLVELARDEGGGNGDDDGGHAERQARLGGDLESAAGVSVGDHVRGMSPGREPFWVKDVDARRWMVWSDKRGDYSWSWVLIPLPDGGTRVVTRERARYPWRSPRLFYALLADAGDLVRVRRLLRSLKQRTEASRAGAGMTIPDAAHATAPPVATAAR